MQSIRWWRVLGGGFLAALVLVLVEGVASQVYLGELTRILAEHELDLGMDTRGTVAGLGMSFVAGCGTVWLYAAILPRYGAGIRPGLIAGLGMWVLWFVPSTVSWSVLGILPGWMAAYELAVALVAIVIAALVGAWVYREPDAP